MKATNIVKASGWLIIWNNTQGAKKGINSKRRLFFFYKTMKDFFLKKCSKTQMSKEKKLIFNDTESHFRSGKSI